jgi:Na+/H+ antiporter NhaD/arsenite permease-like protein
MLKRNVTLQHLLLLAVLVLGLALVLSRGPSQPVAHAEGLYSPHTEGGQVSLFGRLNDPQGEPVRGAEVSLVLNGTPRGASTENEDAPPLAESQPDGAFVVDLPAREVGAIETLVLEISRPHFNSLKWEAKSEEIARLNRGESLRLPDMELSRRMTAGFWVATLTFVAILVIIALEKLHNTMAALLGVAIVLGTTFVGGAISPDLFIFDFERALEYVNFDVIFLVMGMMIVVGVIEKTGIFQWLAYQSYRLSGGQAWLLVTILMLITSVASALLDNVTTMLLVAPITLQIALTVGVDPLSLLIPEMLASNVGGISTLIGTPNNILIGSYAGIGFNDFLRNLTPGVLLAQVALSLYVILTYRKEHQAASEAASPALLARLKENARITQPDTLRKAGAIFLGVLALFIVGEQFHLVPAVTAILGAVAMLLAVRADIEEMLRVVDWTTLMFFIALFIVVGAIQEVGLISYLGAGIHYLVKESLVAATLVTIWATALLCLFIPTIPLTAALLPVVSFLARTLPGAENEVLFYSLSVGSALGANNSLIGATNNMVTAGIAERAGFPITYRRFLNVGFPAAVLTLIVGTLWILIRF